MATSKEVSKEEQREWLLALLASLRYERPREDTDLIERLLDRYGVVRGPDLVEQVLTSPGFERFFLDVLVEVEPFAQMVASIYGFLSSHSTTADAGADSILVTTDGAASAFEFSLTAFPVVLREILATFMAPHETLRLRTADADSWRACAPRWDSDFYDNGFCRMVSYAPTVLQRASPAETTECSQMIARAVDRMRALSQPLLWDELDHGYSKDRIEASWMNGEFERVELTISRPRRCVLDRAAAVNSLLEVAPEPDGVRAPVLGGPTQKSYWDDRRHDALGFAHCVRIWDHDVVRLDHDDWLASRFDSDYDEIQPREFLDALSPLAAAFDHALDRILTVTATRPIQETARALVEFLALPFWDDRPFLYELWTLSYLLNRISESWPVTLQGIVPHENNTLEWALPGRDDEADQAVALIGGAVEVWTALSTTHSDDQSMKPDLRFTSIDDVPKDLMVIECKDRAAPGRRKIAPIVEKYVGGSEANTICLVNADRFSSATKALAGQRGEQHVLIVDRFRPPGPPAEVVRRLNEVLSSEIDEPVVDDPESQSSSEFLEIRLRWQGDATDLDLHGWVESIHGHGMHISYVSPRHNGPPVSELSTDIQESPGEEVLVVEMAELKAVTFAVDLFTGASLLAAEPVVEVSGPIEHVVLTPSGEDDLRWWHVGSFDATTNEFTPLDTMSDDEPPR